MWFILFYILLSTILNANVFSWDTEITGELGINVSYRENEEFMGVASTTLIGMPVLSDS